METKELELLKNELNAVIDKMYLLQIEYKAYQTYKTRLEMNIVNLERTKSL